jgi:solute carrier family 30 (zinc transporter), member 1
MKNSTRLAAVLAISIAFFCAEIAIGFRTKSLVRELFRLPSFINPEPPAKALIADAFHYLNVSRESIFSCRMLIACSQDIVAYLIAFLASHLQEKGYKPSGFTYALHRAELVGGFFNGIFLLALALSIFLQSIERFINIESVEDPLSMLIVGCVGLTLNLISATIVHGRLYLQN